MSEMIERVARAIIGCDPDPRDPDIKRVYDRRWGAAVLEARRAIQAMREPTEAMIVAGVYGIPGGAASGVPVWQAMIDQALQGEKEGGE